MLFVLILGRWVMPKHHEMTRDQLSGVLLSYIGVAADILEFVTETIKDVEIRCDMTVVYSAFKKVF